MATYGGFANPYEGLAQGITSAGENIAKAITEARKAHEEAAGGQLLADQALASGVINHEQYAKFVKGSDSQKNAMIGSIVRTQAFQQNAQQMDIARQANQRAQAELDLRKQQYEYERNFQPGAPIQINVPTGRQTSPFQQQGVPYAPDYTVPETETQSFIRTSPTGAYSPVETQFRAPATVAPVRAEGTNQIIAYPLPTSKGGITYKEPDEAGTAAGAPNVDVIRDPETKQIIGRSVRYPGTKQRDFIPAQELQGMRLNPETNLYEYWSGKAWVPYSQQLQMQIRFGQMQKQREAAAGPGTPPPPGVTPTATPAAGSPEAPLPGSVLSRAWQSITGGGASPTPAAAVPAAADGRAAAIAYLRANGLPPTEGNIQHYLTNASQPQ